MPVPRENILQLLPEAVVPSKEELAAYWDRVAAQALVHLRRRALKLVRHNSEMRVGRTEIAGKFVELLTPEKWAGRRTQHAVVGVEFFNRRAAARSIALAEDFLKIAMKYFVDALTYSVSLCRALRHAA